MKEPSKKAINRLIRSMMRSDGQKSPSVDAINSKIKGWLSRKNFNILKL